MVHAFLMSEGILTKYKEKNKQFKYPNSKYRFFSSPISFTHSITQVHNDDCRLCHVTSKLHLNRWMKYGFISINICHVTWRKSRAKFKIFYTSHETLQMLMINFNNYYCKYSTKPLKNPQRK